MLKCPLQAAPASGGQSGSLQELIASPPVTDGEQRDEAFSFQLAASGGRVEFVEA